MSDPSPLTTDRISILIAATLLLAGCSASETSIDQHDSKVITEAYSIYGDGVVVFKLKDGTRCALYQGYKAGGLSCDWRHDDSAH